MSAKLKTPCSSINITSSRSGSGNNNIGNWHRTYLAILATCIVLSMVEYSPNHDVDDTSRANTLLVGAVPGLAIAFIEPVSGISICVGCLLGYAQDQRAAKTKALDLAQQEKELQIVATRD